MRTSQYFLNTLRDNPADAELISHQLMLKAGLIRKLSSGLYCWLPLGLKILRKVETIVREEMNRIDALELLMPAVQPAELWEESGRWHEYGSELLKLNDRHERKFCFGPTHEEVITHIMRTELQSYKQLPITFYQIQTKFRDEIRPRFGVMRSREFIMKDAYSFHLESTSLEETYEKLYHAYVRIFDRLGLKYRAVIADTGSIGGNQSHEFHVLAEAGEDLIAYCPQSDYAANTEKAEALAQIASKTDHETRQLLDTPSITDMQALAQYLNCEQSKMVKAILLKGKKHPIVMLLLRGDHTLNEIKTSKLDLIHTPVTFADQATIESTFNCPAGYIGPVHVKHVPIIADKDVAVLQNFVCGANQKDKHFKNVNWNEECRYDEVADIRQVVEGDRSPDNQGELVFARGIEVGHIFQLGQKYSQAMNFTVLDKHGKAAIPYMGCYGIGITRIVAAAIEQNHDNHGIIWPPVMAPFQIALIPIGFHKSAQVKQATEKLYQQLLSADIDVILDDRNERPGVMFADMDLIGIPHRIVLGEKNLNNQQVEYKCRSHESSKLLNIEECFDYLIEKLMA